MRKIQIVTLFPEMFKGVLESSMLFKAAKNEIVSYEIINLRKFGKGLRKRVDDTPYGGGDGMLLMVEPLVKAIELAKANDPSAVVILPTPRGEDFKQAAANALAQADHGLILLSPRYEGYDERVTNWVDYQYCIGPYVLTGGELPAMVMIDAIVRLLPGVLGGANSASDESFQGGDEAEYPQYTRPDEFRGLPVPPVLLSGNHRQIAEWRAKHKR